jgi:hypothetical protein
VCILDDALKAVTYSNQYRLYGPVWLANERSDVEQTVAVKVGGPTCEL